jgi:hypothetical protein
MKMAIPDPLTRPAPAGENAVAGHPLPQGGEGFFMTSDEPQDHEALAQDDRLSTPQKGNNLVTVCVIPRGDRKPVTLDFGCGLSYLSHDNPRSILL